MTDENNPGDSSSSDLPGRRRDLERVNNQLGHRLSEAQLRAIMELADNMIAARKFWRVTVFTAGLLAGIAVVVYNVLGAIQVWKSWPHQGSGQ